MRAIIESPVAAAAAAGCERKEVPNIPRPSAAFSITATTHHWAASRRMKCCINEQRPDQKSEQAPMTCYSQADLVGGCLTENHAKDRSRGYKLKECDRR